MMNNKFWWIFGSIIGIILLIALMYFVLDASTLSSLNIPQTSSSSGGGLG